MGAWVGPGARMSPRDTRRLWRLSAYLLLRVAVVLVAIAICSQCAPVADVCEGMPPLYGSDC